MIPQELLIYLIAGAGLGLLLQIIHDLAVRFGNIKLQDYTLKDHIIITLLWPLVIFNTIKLLIFKNETNQHK